MTDKDNDSAQFVDAIGYRWGKSDPALELSTADLDGPSKFEIKINRLNLEGLTPDQIYNGISLEIDPGKEVNFSQLMDKLLKVLTNFKRMSDYSMVVKM